MAAIGIVCAFAAALAYGVASTLQAVAARRTDSGGAVDAGVLIRMVKQLPYLIGTGLDGLGFLISLVALNALPLFFVESVLASSVAVTAILAVKYLDAKLNGIEKWALVALIAGLVMLAASAKPDDAKRWPEYDSWILLGTVVIIALLAAGAMTLKDKKWSGLALAACSGLAFSGMGIAARTLVVPEPIWEALKGPTVYAVLIHGVLGMVLFAAALQRAPVTTVTALVFGTETVVPALVGVVLLGDTARDGFALVAIVGFLLAVGSAIALASQSDVEP